MANRVRRMTLCLLGVVVALRGMDRPAVANATPSWYAQGASLSTSEAMTNVQMVSENVLIVVEGLEEPDPDRQGEAAAYMVGHVDATYVMRNLGTAEESFDVWFPLGRFEEHPWGPPSGHAMDRFAAWVDGTPVMTGQAETRDRWNNRDLWATWPAVFPPGQDVLLRVTYEVLPIGFEPYGTFSYVLETGAGWQGTIGGGTVKIRLPYEVNELNVVLEGHEYARCKPDPEAYFVSGNEVVWSFVNLEPTEDNNICLAVMAVPIWEKLVAAQRAVAEAPTSAHAHVRLARAAAGAVETYSPYASNSVAIEELAWQSCERALEIASDEPEVVVGCTQVMASLWAPSGPNQPRFLEVLDQAIALAPDDDRVLRLKAAVDHNVYLTPWPTTMDESSARDGRPWAASTRTPTAVATYTPPPSPATPAATAAPTTAETSGAGVWWVFCGLALSALAIAGLWANTVRRQRQHRQIRGGM